MSLKAKYRITRPDGQRLVTLYSGSKTALLRLAGKCGWQLNSLHSPESQRGYRHSINEPE
jgi:hypothetical protein